MPGGRLAITVAVIGGGISGLAVAHELMRRGDQVVVLERQVRAGGSAISERIDGFLMEHGPSVVSAASPEAATLERALGLEGERCVLGSRVRYRYLTAGDALGRIGLHPFSLLNASYLTPGARLRLAAEVLVPPGGDGDEETVARFCARRFGRQFAARVMDPLVGSLFAGTAEGLSMAAVFPALVDMERRHGSITRPRSSTGGRVRPCRAEGCFRGATVSARCLGCSPNASGRRSGQGSRCAASGLPVADFGSRPAPRARSTRARW